MKTYTHVLLIGFCLLATACTHNNSITKKVSAQNTAVDSTTKKIESPITARNTTQKPMYPPITSGDWIRKYSWADMGTVLRCDNSSFSYWYRCDWGATGHFKGTYKLKGNQITFKIDPKFSKQHPQIFLEPLVWYVHKYKNKWCLIPEKKYNILIKAQTIDEFSAKSFLTFSSKVKISDIVSPQIDADKIPAKFKEK